jgi:hypothetical protein
MSYTLKPLQVKVLNDKGETVGWADGDWNTDTWELYAPDNDFLGRFESYEALMNSYAPLIDQWLESNEYETW